MIDIKDIRERYQLSIEQFAGVLGISYRTVQRWESGEACPSRLAEREIKRLLAEIRTASTEKDHVG